MWALMGASRVIIVVAIALITIAVYSPVSAKEITVDNDSGADFRSIQEAVNNSVSEDTIIVKPGTYRENVIVNTNRLTVRSESGKPDVLVEPLDENKSAFLIRADNVTITGFNITGAGEPPNYPRGFVARNFTEPASTNRESAAENVPAFIAEEIFKARGFEHYRPPCGISLENASNCVITENVLFENYRGIRLDNSSYNTVSKNLFVNDGIAAGEGSGTNNLTGNIIEKGYILLGPWASNNLIAENKISNGTGISFACCGGGDVVSGNTIFNCSSGVDAYDRAIEIRNNTITNCTHGIELSFSVGTGIYGNKISNCSIGISLGDACRGIEILNNTIISSADCGISIPDQEDDEWIYNNYFNNTMNIRLGISEGNIWNSSLTSGTNIVGGPSLGGNFWANPNGTGFSQTSEDFDLDGICDSAYEIEGPENTDYLPLSRPPESVAISVGDDESDADYDSIREAVSAADPGSTILVYPGTYVENVAVAVEGLKIYSRSINPEEVTVQALNPDENTFQVTANNVTICGFTVKGAGTESDTSGIYVDSVSGCRLCNNKVTESVFGIVLLASSNNTLSNNSAEINGDSGIYLNSSDNNLLLNNTAYNSNSSSGPALYLSNSGSNILRDNELLASYYGILIGSSENNTIIRNSLRENTDCGILLADSNGNRLYDNYFNNSINVKFEGSENNTWNIEGTRGTNFMGGPYLGGNFWAKPDGSGFSETAEDSDIDGLSDSAYNIENTGKIDAIPLVRAPGPVLLIKGGAPVADFSSIQAAVDSATPGSTVLVYPGTYEENILLDVENISLVSESVDPGSTIIKASNKTGTVIKVTSKGVTVSGFYITRPHSLRKEASGIYLLNTSENTIKNNVISEYLYGVHLVSSDRNNITNNTVENNQRGAYLQNSEANLLTSNMVSTNTEGIVLDSSGNNSLKNNTIYRNENQGLYIYSGGHGHAASNLIIDNLISKNNHGIYTSFSENNTARNNIITLNAEGIVLLNSNDNLFRDNLIESNRDFGLYMSFCRNNTFYNNLFNNTQNLEPAYGNQNISWNNTKTSGKNIIGGPNIGGNFWAKPDGTGFGQNCTDLDKDGICDYPYEVNVSEFDYLPLYPFLQEGGEK
ncbi:right-handed parallel beta-helix repeat-containing protein [Methanosarcina sp. T3]|uniref:right-handed parallel beta-helix repeat-containing protein n=1 Tax=Methanosarcina sp. T3 TaxID=3439062 RepID=UPI003F8465EA